MTGRSSRREFLKGKAARNRSTDRVPDASNGEPAGHETAPYLIHFTRQAMACNFTVYLPAEEESRAAEPVLSALDLVQRLEAQLTVYRDDSELSRINAQAAECAVPVEPQLRELLQLASQISEQTGQAFDVTSAPLSKLWGVHRREGELPSQSAIQQVLGQVGSQLVTFDPLDGCVRFAKPGVELNLGGIGKGYALDRCRQLLRAGGVSNFLMHGGQSSVLATGSRRGDADPSHGWQIEIRHPYRDQQLLATVTLRNQALGTSGSARQSFIHRGKRYGHILDPRSGWPAEGVLSATAITDSAAVADAMATACFVMGVEPARQLMAADPKLSALIVTAGEAAGTVVLHALNLPDDDWECHDVQAAVYRSVVATEAPASSSRRGRLAD